MSSNMIFDEELSITGTGFLIDKHSIGGENKILLFGNVKFTTGKLLYRAFIGIPVFLLHALW